jgi:sucrose-6-phosphate hydrolase SacC (GH32 family)
MLGWLKGAHYPDSPFSQGMTVPLELSLAKSTEPDAPYRLCFSPVEELNRLVVSAVQAAALTSSQLNDLTADFQPEDLLDLRMVCESREPFTLTFGDTQLEWDPAKSALSFAGKSAKLAEPGESLRLRLLIDRSVTEIFINEGRAAFAAATLFSEGQQKIKSEGRLKITSLQIHLLKSIWE